MQNIALQDIPRALYFWWLCELFYTITTVLIRVSIAVFLLRICVKPSHKYIIYGTLAAVIAFSTFYSFLVLFQCSPVSFFWAQYEGMKGSCINVAVVPDASIAHSVVSFSADVSIPKTKFLFSRLSQELGDVVCQASFWELIYHELTSNSCPNGAMLTLL